MSPTQDDELCPDLPGSDGPKKFSSPSDIEQSFSDKLSSGESGGTQMKYLKFGEERFSFCLLKYSGDHRTSEYQTLTCLLFKWFAIQIIVSSIHRVL